MKKLILLLIIITINQTFSYNEWEKTFSKYNIIAEAMVCPDSNNCFIIMSNGKKIDLYKSINQGDSWQLIKDQFPGAETANSMSIPDSQNIFISFFYGGIIFKSNDGGKTFEKITLDTKLSVEAIEMRNKNIGIAFTNLAYYVTYNGWKTNKKIDLVPYGYAVSPKFINDSIVKMVYLNETGFYFSILNIKTQATELSFITESKNDVSDLCMINENLMFVCGKNNIISGGSGHDVIYKSTDGGKSWHIVLDLYNDRKFDNDFRNPFGLQSIAFIDSLKGIAVGQFGKILYTYDAGESWIYEDELPEDIKKHTPPTMIIRYAGSTPIIADFLGNIYKLRKDNHEPGESNKYQISGRVWEGKSWQSGIPILNGYQVAMTDINGYYKFQKLSKNTYNIKAVNKYFDGANSNYYYRPFLYSPEYYNIELTRDTSGFDFNAEDIRNNFTVSGIIKGKDGKVLPEVEVMVGDNSTITESLGVYSFFICEKKDYIIRAKKDNFIFTPTSYDTLITNHSFKFDFIGELNTGMIDAELNDFEISPNPATDYITINPGNEGLKPFAETDEQVEIYNSLGELVLKDVPHLQDVAHLNRIDVSHLPVGLYFVKIGNRIEKFVKI